MQLPDDLLSKIATCDAPPPNADKALRAAWQRKCCDALKRRVRDLKRAIHDAPFVTGSHVYLWYGHKDRVIAQQAGKPHLKIRLSNSYPRSRCLAASIAFAALLLIVPGFFTDLIGFLFLVPFTRNIFFNLVIKEKAKKGNKPHDKTIEGEIIENNKDEL